MPQETLSNNLTVMKMPEVQIDPHQLFQVSSIEKLLNYDLKIPKNIILFINDVTKKYLLNPHAYIVGNL